MGKVLKNMPFSFPPVLLCGHLWFTIENKASSPSHSPRITGERSRGDLKLISSPVSSLAQSRACTSSFVHFILGGPGGSD